MSGTGTLLDQLFGQLDALRGDLQQAQRRAAQLEAENADLRAKVIHDDDIPPGPVDAP